MSWLVRQRKILVPDYVECLAPAFSPYFAQKHDRWNSGDPPTCPLIASALDRCPSCRWLRRKYSVFESAKRARRLRESMQSLRLRDRSCRCRRTSCSGAWLLLPRCCLPSSTVEMRRERCVTMKVQVRKDEGLLMPTLTLMDSVERMMKRPQRRRIACRGRCPKVPGRRRGEVAAPS